MTQPDLQQGCLYPESKALQTKHSITTVRYISKTNVKIKGERSVPGERFLSF